MATSALLILALFTGCLGHQATDHYDTDNTYDFNSDAKLSVDYSDSRISKSEDEEYDYSGDAAEEEEEDEWWPEEVHLPNFTSVESEHSIIKGATLRLTCSVDSLQKGLLIWTKESQMLYLGNTSQHDQGEKYRLEPLGGSGSVLSVRQLDTEDAGVYTCQESAGQKKQNHTVYIQEPATIHIQFNKAREKENLYMACFIMGGPPSAMIWWSKDGVMLTEKKKKARKLVYETEATREESGNYTCHMNNITKTIEVKILYGPDVEIGQVHLEDDMGYRETWVRCAVRSEPPSRVTWARDGQVWNMTSADAPMYAEDVDEWNHTLQIPSNPNSAGVVTGVFSCRATNGLNTVTQNTTVRGWYQCSRSQQLVRLSTKGLTLVRGRRPVVHAWLCKQGNKEGEQFEYKYSDDDFVPEFPPYKETLLFHEPGDIQISSTSYNSKGASLSVSKSYTLVPSTRTSKEPPPTKPPTALPKPEQTTQSTINPPSSTPTPSISKNKSKLPKSQQPPEVSTAVSPRTQRTTEDYKTYKVYNKKTQDVGQGVEREQGENLVIGWLCGGIVGLALLVFLVTILKRMWKRRRAQRQQWRRPPLQWQVSALGARMARETVI